jgi:hypothetical protein
VRENGGNFCPIPNMLQLLKDELTGPPLDGSDDAGRH